MSSAGTAALNASSATPALPIRGALPGAGLALLALTPAFLSPARINMLETATAGGLLLLVVLLAAWLRRVQSGGTALALALLYFATLANLSPLSLRNTLQQGWPESSALHWLAMLLPLGAAALLALVTPAPTASPDRISPYLHSAAISVNLWLVACLALTGGLLLGGYSVRHVLPLAPLMAAGVLAIRPVYSLASNAAGSRLLCAGLALVLLINCGSGLQAWANLGGVVERGSAAVAAGRNDEAATVLNEALKLNERVQSRSRQLESLRQLGTLYEKMQDFQTALHYWRLVAELSSVEFGQHPAVRRILVRQGDSLLGWRQLVYQGFPSVMNDELIPGFMALAERPDADVRGTLMGALVGWERGDPETKRREQLERVLARRPNEVSACALLNVLGRPLPKESLWLGEDLLVGTQPTHHSLNGHIVDLGSVESLVFLTEGNWECRVQARGTPLNEEWPILRVEIDGVEALRARVNKAEAMQLPFTFEIKRRNLYRIRFVFENRLQVFQGTQRAFRGLAVDGVHFQRAHH